MKKIIVVCISLLLVPFATTAVAATTRTWNGETDGLWSAAENWSPEGTPETGDDVVISSGESVVIDCATPLIDVATFIITPLRSKNDR